MPDGEDNIKITEEQIPYFEILKVNDESSTVEVEFTINVRPPVSSGTWVPQPVKVSRDILVDRLSDGTFDEQNIIRAIKHDYGAVYKAAQKEYEENIKKSVSEMADKFKYKKIKLTDDDLNYTYEYLTEGTILSPYGTSEKIQNIRHIVLETLTDLGIIK